MKSIDPNQNHRQGDLLFVPIPRDKVPFNYNKKHANYRKDGIIREGEATGHHHKLKEKGSAEVYRFKHDTMGNPIVKVGDKGATVVHDEHGPVKLAPNQAYEVRFAREQDLSGQVRSVVD